jgi:hypothetical protein
MVEIMGRAYNKTTLAPLWTIELGDLFSVPTPRCAETQATLCWQEGDPRVVFDAPSGRFIATYQSFIENPSGPDDARLHVAVSYTSDPRGAWCLVTHPSLVGLYRYDEPSVGVTGDKITVSWNWIGIENNSFLGADTRVYNKQDMLDCELVRVVRMGHNPSLFAVRAAQQMTPGNTQVAATIEGNTLKVIRYNGLPGSSGITQTVTNVAVSGHAAPLYANAPGAAIDTGDGRLLDAFVDGSRLWVTTNTACEITGSASLFDECAQLIEADLGTNTERQNIVHGAKQISFYYPAARTDGFGNLIGAMAVSDGARHPGVELLSRRDTDPLGEMYFAGVAHLGEASIAEPPGVATPWGSYFGAARDPAGLGGCVWTVGQYAKDVSGVSGGNDWGTVISKVKYGPGYGTCEDYDGDGFGDVVEAQNIGTSSTAECGTGGWPLDLVGGGPSQNRVTLSDLGSFYSPVPYFNTDVGTHPGDHRWDLMPGSASGPDINVQDIGALLAGPTSMPPMLGGAAAFNGPSCPAA